MTFQALYKNVVIRRWCVCVLCVCVCVFCRSGGEFYSQTLPSRVRGCSTSSLPFTIYFVLLLPNSQVKFFFFSSVIAVVTTIEVKIKYLCQKPPILDSVNKYLLRYLECLLFHEFSRFLFLIVSFLTGYGRRSSSAQISRDSKKGKMWQNIRKTCCKIVENSCFKCFIGLVTLLSTGALVSESSYFYGKKMHHESTFMKSPCQIIFPQNTYYSTKFHILGF